MRTLKPENRVKRRIKELQEIFNNVDEDKKKVVGPLINYVAKMEAQLDELLTQLDRVGFVEEYQNGENQFGKKESTESRAYSNVFKNYVNSIRTLLTCLPETAPPQAEDQLEEFLKRHKR